MKARASDQGDEKRKFIWFQVSGLIGTTLFFLFYDFVLSTLSSTLPFDSPVPFISLSSLMRFIF